MQDSLVPLCSSEHDQKKCIEDTEIHILKWSSQSPDLDPVENLCRELKVNSLGQLSMEEWATTPQRHELA